MGFSSGDAIIPYGRFFTNGHKPLFKSCSLISSPDNEVGSAFVNSTEPAFSSVSITTSKTLRLSPRFTETTFPP